MEADDAIDGRAARVVSRDLYVLLLCCSPAGGEGKASRGGEERGSARAGTTEEKCTTRTWPQAATRAGGTAAGHRQIETGAARGCGCGGGKGLTISEFWSLRAGGEVAARRLVPGAGQRDGTWTGARGTAQVSV